MPDLLRAGDEMKCWRCDAWHVLQTSGTKGPYAGDMLFLTCADGKLYAGNVGNRAEQPVRPPTSREE